MKNKLTDLNNHLFEQMERLNDDDLNNEDLQKEIGRAKAMTQLSCQIINNAKLELDAIKFCAEYDANVEKLPAMLNYVEKKV